MVSLVKVGKFNGYFSIDDLCDDREAFKQFVFDFCKERELEFVVELNSDDYLEDDGSTNEDTFLTDMHDQSSEVFAEIAERVSYAYDLTDDECRHLYYVISELDLEYIDNPVLAVYDLAGKMWPAPEDK